MKKLVIKEILDKVNGKSDYPETAFRGVFTDTRKPLKGGLFIALKGENFNGNDFVEKAFDEGANAVLCDKSVKTPRPAIFVDDVSVSLLLLARYYGSLFNIPTVGITGSVGKTTTKDMTALVLSGKFKTVKTEGNLNNNIGLPMSIFNIEEDTEAAVFEMGMNHKGEISSLSKTLRPALGVITNIGSSHIENLGSRENILKAKMEILDGMEKGAVLLLNGDCDLLENVRLSDYNVIFFGINNKNCEIRAEKVEILNDCTRFDISYNSKSYPVVLPVAGEHFVYDALAAFSAGVLLGADPLSAGLSLKSYAPSGLRQKIEIVNGATFIEDCYNASPDSVKAAINVLSNMKDKRKIAVLGDMLELGVYSQKAHEDLGKYLVFKNIDILFTYGEKSRFIAKEANKNGMNAKNIHSFIDKDEISKALKSTIKEGDAVLFKASRGMKLENVINNLL